MLSISKPARPVWGLYGIPQQNFHVISLLFELFIGPKTKSERNTRALPYIIINWSGGITVSYNVKMSWENSKTSLGTKCRSRFHQNVIWLKLKLTELTRIQNSHKLFCFWTDSLRYNLKKWRNHFYFSWLIIHTDHFLRTHT